MAAVGVLEHEPAGGAIEAFCKYYFFVIGAICCALAAWVSLTPASRGVCSLLIVTRLPFCLIHERTGRGR
jgi:hypothetical protein